MSDFTLGVVNVWVVNVLQSLQLHNVWALYYIHIVIDLTLKGAEHDSQRSEQPENDNFEPIIRGLKNDNFDWNQG